MTNPKTPALALSCLLAAPNALGQHADLEEIIVTANPLRVGATDLAQAAVVLSGDDLARRISSRCPRNGSPPPRRGGSLPPRAAGSASPPSVPSDPASNPPTSSPCQQWIESGTRASAASAASVSTPSSAYCARARR